MAYNLGDMDCDGDLDFDDIAPFVLGLTDDADYIAKFGISPDIKGDLDRDGDNDFDDIPFFIQTLIDNVTIQAPQATSVADPITKAGFASPLPSVLESTSKTESPRALPAKLIGMRLPDSKADQLGPINHPSRAPSDSKLQDHDIPIRNLSARRPLVKFTNGPILSVRSGNALTGPELASIWSNSQNWLVDVRIRFAN